MKDDYLDIINIPRPEPKMPRMTRAQRAAQFSPFAALKGYEDALSLKERVKFDKIELSDDEKKEINEKLCTLINSNRRAKITYFNIDEYIKSEGCIKKAIDHVLIMDDKTKIKIDDILSITT